MTKEERQKAKSYARRLAPFVQHLVKTTGCTVEEAIPLAHEKMQALTREIKEGKTQRSRKIRFQIALRVWEEINGSSAPEEEKMAAAKHYGIFEDPSG